MTPEAARWPLIAGNWKLWGTRAQAADYCEQLVSLLPGDDARHAAIGICPVYTALEACVQALEGSWTPGRLVILEFPSLAKAREWWDSPEYAPARALRQATSRGSLVVLEGL